MNLLTKLLIILRQEKHLPSRKNIPFIFAQKGQQSLKKQVSEITGLLKIIRTDKLTTRSLQAIDFWFECFCKDGISWEIDEN